MDETEETNFVKNKVFKHDISIKNIQTDILCVIGEDLTFIGRKETVSYLK